VIGNENVDMIGNENVDMIGNENVDMIGNENVDMIGVFIPYHVYVFIHAFSYSENV
jgi:hypothetical protein